MDQNYSPVILIRSIIWSYPPVVNNYILGKVLEYIMAWQIHTFWKKSKQPVLLWISIWSYLILKLNIFVVQTNYFCQDRDKLNAILSIFLCFCFQVPSVKVSILFSWLSLLLGLAVLFLSLFLSDKSQKTLLGDSCLALWYWWYGIPQGPSLPPIWFIIGMKQLHKDLEWNTISMLTYFSFSEASEQDVNKCLRW